MLLGNPERIWAQHFMSTGYDDEAQAGAYFESEKRFSFNAMLSVDGPYT